MRMPNSYHSSVDSLSLGFVLCGSFIPLAHMLKLLVVDWRALRPLWLNGSQGLGSESREWASTRLNTSSSTTTEWYD